MLKDRDKLYQFYHVVLCMALTWALVLVFDQYFSLRVPIYLSAIFSFLLIVLLYIFDLSKKNVITYIVILCVIFLLALVFLVKQYNLNQWLKNYMEWCNNYDGSHELFSVQFSYFTEFLVALLGGLLLYVLIKRHLAKELLAIIILVALIALSINNVNVNKVVIAISIFYILSIVIELYGIIYSSKTGKQNKKEGILYLAPICLILSILAISLPSQPHPIKWTAVKMMSKSIKDQIEIWQTDFDYYFGNRESEFFGSLSGYSEESGNLTSLGRLQKDEKVALKISGLHYEDKIYLTGSTSDIYTGTSWEKSEKEYLTGEQDYLLDYTELFMALSRQDFEVLKNNRFVKRKEIQISYNKIKTKTFFYPLKTSNFILYSNNTKLLDTTAHITFKKARGMGTTYKSIYFNMNLKGEAFQQMLREADTFSYNNNSLQYEPKKTAWIQNNLLNNDMIEDLIAREDIYEMLRKRAELIKTTETALPEELPVRVRKLANEITADYDTTYDKLKAIEAYLMRYTYTLEPKKMTKGEDFVDYFLFEGKSGYCTSFATAMAVMGRCIGVPTRYVEGFVAKYDSKERDYVIPVKNSQAHAWAEAYIEGVGWIPFEATASYYGSRYTKWEELTNKNAGDSTSIITPYDLEKLQQKNSSDVNMQALHISNMEIEKKGHWDDIIVGIIITFSFICCFILGIIIYYHILKYRYKKAFKKADNSRKMYMLFLRILRLLKREGYVLEQQETILMLSERIGKQYQYNKVAFDQVAEIYMRYRYADEEITKKDLGKVTDFHQGLHDKRREDMNWLKAWMKEFALFIQTDRQLRHRYNNG